MGSKLTISPSPIQGVALIQSPPITDSRGSFSRWFCQQELASILGTREVCQMNNSITHNIGSIRGLHYQHPPHSEMKLIRCFSGKVWDVAVDLRCNSTTFLQHACFELSGENATMLVIPEGVAHGFQTMEANSQMLYLHTAFYQPEAEYGLNALDPKLNICWPLPITEMSDRDKGFANIDAKFKGL